MRSPPNRRTRWRAATPRARRARCRRSRRAMRRRRSWRWPARRERAPSLTHRLMLLMSGPTISNTPGWLGGDAGVRSAAEPMLNFWACKLLGDGSKIRCTIERLDDTSGAVAETRKLPLSELAITPLDVVYGVEAASNTAQPTVRSARSSSRFSITRSTRRAASIRARRCDCSMRVRRTWPPARPRCSTRSSRRAPSGGC